ncbi:hypothetical protein ACR2VP_26485, partial [Klebsiella pneumoniae]
RKRAYCLKIQPATGSFARNLIYSTKPLAWYGKELDLAASRLKAELMAISVLREEVSMAVRRKKGDAS